MRPSDASGLGQGTPLRAAVIGCGNVGTMHANALALQDSIELVAVADPCGVRREGVAQRLGIQAFVSWESLLESIPLDLVTIATPDDQHVEPTLAFLESGCHVFCEKPLALTADDAVSMVRKACQAGRSLGVDFNRRYGFAYQEARRQIDAGRIGKPQGILLNVVDRFPAMALRTAATAMLTTLLTHHFDLVRWFLGEVIAVFSSGRMDSASQLVTPFSIVLTCEEGAVATIIASYQTKQARTWEAMTIVGSDGVIQANDVVGTVSWRAADSEETECVTPSSLDWSQAFWETIPSHLSSFVSAIQARRPPPISGDDGLASLRIAEAAARSWKEKRVVEVQNDR